MRKYAKERPRKRRKLNPSVSSHPSGLIAEDTIVEEEDFKEHQTYKRFDLPPKIKNKKVNISVSQVPKIKFSPKKQERIRQEFMNTQKELTDFIENIEQEKQKKPKKIKKNIFFNEEKHLYLQQPGTFNALFKKVRNQFKEKGMEKTMESSLDNILDQNNGDSYFNEFFENTSLINWKSKKNKTVVHQENGIFIYSIQQPSTTPEDEKIENDTNKLMQGIQQMLSLPNEKWKEKRIIVKEIKTNTDSLDSLKTEKLNFFSFMIDQKSIFSPKTCFLENRKICLVYLLDNKEEEKELYKRKEEEQTQIVSGDKIFLYLKKIDSKKKRIEQSLQIINSFINPLKFLDFVGLSIKYKISDYVFKYNSINQEIKNLKLLVNPFLKIQKPNDFSKHYQKTHQGIITKDDNCIIFQFIAQFSQFFSSENEKEFSLSLQSINKLKQNWTIHSLIEKIQTIISNFRK